MAKKVGYNCKVAIGMGKGQVLGIGTWSIDGITADQMDVSEFKDNWKTFEFGMKDGGTISFDGLFDMSTAQTSQDTLRYYNEQNSDVTALFLYVDNTSFWAPCQTTSYWSRTHTADASTEYSWVNIISWNIAADKSGMVTCNFSAKVSGAMVMA